MLTFDADLFIPIKVRKSEEKEDDKNDEIKTYHHKHKNEEGKAKEDT